MKQYQKFSEFRGTRSILSADRLMMLTHAFLECYFDSMMGVSVSNYSGRDTTDRIVVTGKEDTEYTVYKLIYQAKMKIRILQNVMLS